MIEIANVKGWSERKVAWTYSPRQLRLIFTTILRSRFAPIEMILRGLGVATKGDEATEAPAEKSVARKAKPKPTPAKGAAKPIPAWIRKRRMGCDCNNLCPPGYNTHIVIQRRN